MQPAAPAAIVPAPTSVVPSGSTFTITEKTSIVTQGAADAVRIAEYLATILRRSTGYPIPLRTVSEGADPTGAIRLVAHGADTGDEGYRLEITADSIELGAHKPAGLFHGVQTLRQLLPPQIESATAARVPWVIPGGVVTDNPRFAWRGAMLDVARHFFSVGDVKRYLDNMALYKLNVLHLHLSDDQGWRIAIKSWPNLTEIGARSEVGGGKGGFYTEAEYAEIVAYAASRYVTIVPEIDMPGHTNAALSSYPELNCDGKAPEPYTGIKVGFSSLCVGAEATWRFVDDVVAQLAAATPGEYLHIGGDEVETLTDEEYTAFIERAQGIVVKHGKKVIGWGEIGKAKLAPTTVVQHWNTGASDDAIRAAVRGGSRVLMSPASKVYLDMKYDEDTELGLKWAGLIDVRDAWDWDPAKFVTGVEEQHLIGIEAPIWSETLTTIEEVESQAFPRLAAVAEVGWSAAEGRDWEDFRSRLAAQGRRWDVLGLKFYRSPQIDW